MRKDVGFLQSEMQVPGVAQIFRCLILDGCLSSLVLILSSLR